jgi:hypothetical protein
MRFVIAPAIVVLLLLAACGGSSNSSPTPAVSPTPSPAPVACTAQNLYAAVVTSEPAQNSQFLTLGLGNTLDRCLLDTPPEINWYDAAGTKLNVMPATDIHCQPQAGDFSTCVYDGQYVLEAGQPTPAANVSGQAIVFIRIANVETFAPCDTPNVTAHFVGLSFPGVTPDIQVELPADIEMQTCATQVTLQGYGPLAAGEPLESETPAAS